MKASLNYSRNYMLQREASDKWGSVRDVCHSPEARDQHTRVKCLCKSQSQASQQEACLLAVAECYETPTPYRPL